MDSNEKDETQSVSAARNGADVEIMAAVRSTIDKGSEFVKHIVTLTERLRLTKQNIQPLLTFNQLAQCSFVYALIDIRQPRRHTQNG